MTTEERLSDIIAGIIGVSEDKLLLYPNKGLDTDYGADSLDMVEIVQEIEEEFDINIPDQEAERLNTFGKIVEFVKQQPQ